MDKANVDANNALIMDDSNTLIDIKGLDFSIFFENPDGKIDHLIGGRVLGLDN